MARYARDTDARTLQDVLPGADVFLGLSAPRVLKPEWLHAAGAEAADPGAGQSGSRDPARAGRRCAARRDRGHRPQRLSQPGQQRPVLPVHLPRRAGCLRHHDQRGDEDRRGRGDRRAGAHGGVRGGRRGLWRRRAGVRPRLHHPQAVRSAPDPGDRTGGRARGDGRAASRAGRSTTSHSISASWSASCSAPASSCGRCSRPRSKAPRRIVYGEGEDERVLRAAQTLVDDGIARPILLGRHAVIERKVHEMGLRIDLDRWRARARSRRRTTTCSARCWPTTSAWSDAAASRRRTRRMACRGAARSRRRCCCMPAWRTRRSAAAAQTGGGRSSTCCRSSRAVRG